MRLPSQFDVLRPRTSEIALAGIVFMALALRLRSMRESLWVDELHTAWCALGSIGEVAGRAALGNQSPLFFWAEWLVLRLLGPSEMVLRLPALIGGLLLIVATYQFGRRWSSPGVGLVAAAMLAVDPMAIFYATEARPYAVVQWLAVVHVTIALRLVEHPSRLLRGVWIGVGALVFYLHYTAALLIVAECFFFAAVGLWGQNRGGYRWFQNASDVVVLGLLTVPALWHVSEVFSHRENWEFVKKGTPFLVFEWWSAGLGCFYLAAALCTRRLPAERRDVLLVILLIWFLIPVALAWLATETDFARLFFPRYLVAVQPAAVLMASSCLTLAPWRWSQWLVGGLLVGAAVCTSGVVDRLSSDGLAIAPRGEDWQAAIDWLNHERQSRPLPVIVASGLIEFKELATHSDPALEDYCLYPVRSLYPLEADRHELAPLVLDEQGHIQPVLEMLAVHRGGAWVIVRGTKATAEKAGRGLAVQLTQGDGPRWQSRLAASFPGVQILLVEVAQP